MTNLNLALQLADRGWFIFPCNLDKTPKLKWKDRSTIDQVQIRRWWTSWPDALIGIYCQKSGFFVVDIDAKNGHEGFIAWKRLINLHNGGDQPIIGPMQHTPSGGAHLLFKLPADIIIPNNAGKLGDGLDLRSDGYICSGGAYQWQPDHGPELQLTPAPAWLLQLIQKTNKKNIMEPKVINRSRKYTRINRIPREITFIARFEAGNGITLQMDRLIQS